MIKREVVTLLGLAVHLCCSFFCCDGLTVCHYDWRTLAITIHSHAVAESLWWGRGNSTGLTLVDVSGIPQREVKLALRGEVAATGGLAALSSTPHLVKCEPPALSSFHFFTSMYH